MPDGSLLGFDFGEARLGIAVGNLQTATTQALTTLKVKNDQPDWNHVLKLINEWKPVSLVVGLPLDMDGNDLEVTKKARKFGNRLNGRYNLPVHMVDERLTTRIASTALAETGLKIRKHKSVIDQLAAQYILQTYITEQQAGNKKQTGDQKGELPLEPEH